MPIDVRKITEARKAEREAVVNPEFRQAMALELIADTLEAIRAEMVGTQTLLAQIARKP